MAIHSFRPLTPAGRFTSLNKQKELSKKRPERALTENKHKTFDRYDVVNVFFMHLRNSKFDQFVPHDNSASDLRI